MENIALNNGRYNSLELRYNGVYHRTKDLLSTVYKCKFPTAKKVGLEAKKCASRAQVNLQAKAQC